MDNRTSKILVVDDKPANLRLLAGILKEQGYKVRLARNGHKALSSAFSFPPDLILLDIKMPGMNGYQVCEAFKANERTRDIPVLFISALDEALDKVKAFAAGGVDYITKPFQVEEVLARIATHLTLQRLQTELQQANEVLEQRVALRTAQLAQLNEAYECFVPKEFLQLLDKEQITSVALGDQIQQEMTVMFSDIRSFTTLSENMTPQDNFNFLNAYLRRVSPIIRQHQGFIDKYIGDAVMALFPKQPEHAIQSAIEMQKEVRRYNIQRQAKNDFPISIGIGIHTGSMMLGILGEEKRKQGTVISDAVNLAARLETLTKKYAASILISQETLQASPNMERHHFRFLGNVQVRGKQKPTPIFEVFDGDSSQVIELKLKTKSDFEAGLSLYYAKELSQACQRFDRVCLQNPQDKAARVYLEQVTDLMGSAIGCSP